MSQFRLWTLNSSRFVGATSWWGQSGRASGGTESTYSECKLTASGPGDWVYFVERKCQFWVFSCVLSGVYWASSGSACLKCGVVRGRSSSWSRGWKRCEWTSALSARRANSPTNKTSPSAQLSLISTCRSPPTRGCPCPTCRCTNPWPSTRTTGFACSRRTQPSPARK